MREAQTHRTAYPLAYGIMFSLFPAIVTPYPTGMSSLTDSFGRTINYARLSVTDRCDFRCVYCMAEDMTFLPRKQVLSLEELLLVAKGLVKAGVSKIRLTGGEPLIRNNIMWLIERLGQLDGLSELTLTTNGSQLAKYAPALKQAGVARLNISLDSLKPEKFASITRTGKLQQVLDGIDAAQQAGFEKIKLNAVILKNRNHDEILDLVAFALNKKLGISFIEEMPLGDIIEHDRALAFCSSDEVREIISREYKLEQSAEKTNGPSRYLKISSKDGSLHESSVGFISPHSHNFCGECNRIRVTVEGRVLFCLGNEHSLDLREPIRNHQGEAKERVELIEKLIKDNLHLKPEKHHFDLEQETDIVRFMNMTGG